MDYEILLINVMRDYSGGPEAYRESIGQYLLAAYLRQNDFKAYVFAGDPKKCKEIIKREIEACRTQVIGFYAAADNIRVVEHVIKWIKEEFPNCKTIVGGPQAAGLDFAFFQRTNNDYAIVGEGEIPLHYLLASIIDDTISLDSVPSLIRKSADGEFLLINSSENVIISDLDSVGYPKQEDSLNGRLRQGEVVGIITGRGCPYHCAFCYEGANAKNVRMRSISNVIEEIDYICEHNKNLKFISIYDDTFTLDSKRILEFCKEIKKRNIRWFCEGHITFVINHEDVLKQMVESGLTCIQFGIESGSNTVLRAYNKHTNQEMIIKAIEICKKIGMHSITGNFIIGGAFESRETIEESKKLARELIHRAKGIIELYTVYFAPYPNTKMVRNPEQFDIEIHNDWLDLEVNSMRTPVIETKDLTRNDIYDLKHDFDAFLKEEYEQAAKESTKSDIIQGMINQGIRTSVNPTWKSLYLNLPHIALFLDHLAESEQLFNLNYYIIRTFEDIKIENDKLVSDVGVFEGLEKNLLMNATGVYTAQELAKILGVSIKEIEDCYYNLNEKCLVYMAEF